MKLKGSYMLFTADKTPRFMKGLSKFDTWNLDVLVGGRIYASTAITTKSSPFRPR